MFLMRMHLFFMRWEWATFLMTDQVVTAICFSDFLMVSKKSQRELGKENILWRVDRPVWLTTSLFGWLSDSHHKWYLEYTSGLFHSTRCPPYLYLLLWMASFPSCPNVGCWTTLFAIHLPVDTELASRYWHSEYCCDEYERVQQCFKVLLWVPSDTYSVERQL